MLCCLTGLVFSRAALGFLYQGTDERELKGMTAVTCPGSEETSGVKKV